MSCGCLAFAPDDPECGRLGLGAAALRYAGMGYPVLPLAAGGKRPHQMLAGTDGVHQATLDFVQVEGWWLCDRAANVGVAAGMRSGLVVLDVDVKGADGRSSLDQFLAANRLSLPWDCAVQTPSGGWHFWLNTGLVVPTRIGILPGVDIKGEGGYVAAPPSMVMASALRRSDEHPSAGGEQVPLPYELVSGCPHNAPAMPAWVQQWAHTAPPSPRPGSPVSDGDVVPLDQAAKVEHGSRNTELYRLACSLYARAPATADGDATVLAQLREVWQDPGFDRASFPWSEVMTLATSARRFIGQDRAGWAEVARRHIAGE